MDSPDLDRVIRIKTSTAGGGLIENAFFVRNVTVVSRSRAPAINLQYENRETVPVPVLLQMPLLQT